MNFQELNLTLVITAVALAGYGIIRFMEWAYTHITVGVQ